MNLELNIYDKQQIIKTYAASTYDLMFGTVEDLISLIDLDGVQEITDKELIKVAGKVIANGMNVIKPLLKDIFEGLSDEELRQTKTKDVVRILMTVVKFTISEVSGSANGKN